MFKSQQKLSEDRLKAHKVDTNTCQRELQRDRQELDRSEQKIMAQIKVFADKGQMNKARILAHQVSKYRTLSDRNFQTATTIQSQAQVLLLYSPFIEKLMLSNFRIQDSKIRAMGGKQWNQKHLMKEQFGIAQRLEEYEMIETLCTKHFDNLNNSKRWQRRRR